MITALKGLFSQADNLQMQVLQHRLNRSHTISANIANAETPGYRALGYEFEEQLQALNSSDNAESLKVSHPRHFKHRFANANGTVQPEVYIRPTETVPNDGNTVDIDTEMATMAENQILYRSAVELLNRKVGMLKYAINGGR